MLKKGFANRSLGTKAILVAGWARLMMKKGFVKRGLGTKTILVARLSPVSAGFVKRDLGTKAVLVARLGQGSRSAGCIRRDR